MKIKKIILILIIFSFLLFVILKSIDILAIKKLNLIDVCVAKKLLKPREKINEKNVYTTKMPKNFITSNIFFSCEDVVGKNVLINNFIAQGSYIYKDEVEELKDKKDFPLSLLKENQVAYHIDISNLEVMNNNIMLYQKIDCYATIRKDNETISDLVLENVRIIGLYDLKSQPYINSKTQQLSQIVLAIENDQINILNKLKAIAKFSFFQKNNKSDKEALLNKESALLKVIK